MGGNGTPTPGERGPACTPQQTADEGKDGARASSAGEWARYNHYDAPPGDDCENFPVPGPHRRAADAFACLQTVVTSCSDTAPRSLSFCSMRLATPCFDKGCARGCYAKTRSNRGEWKNGLCRFHAWEITPVCRPHQNPDCRIFSHRQVSGLACTAVVVISRGRLHD